MSAPARLFEKGDPCELTELPGKAVVADTRGFFRGHWHYVVDVIDDDGEVLATYLVAEYGLI